MALLTDEIVDKAARAIMTRTMGDLSDTPKDTIEVWMSTTFRDDARVCLEAALPSILLKCELEVYRALGNTDAAHKGAEAVRKLGEAPKQ